MVCAKVEPKTSISQLPIYELSSFTAVGLGSPYAVYWLVCSLLSNGEHSEERWHRTAPRRLNRTIVQTEMISARRNKTPNGFAGDPVIMFFMILTCELVHHMPTRTEPNKDQTCTNKASETIETGRARLVRRCGGWNKHSPLPRGLALAGVGGAEQGDCQDRLETSEVLQPTVGQTGAGCGGGGKKHFPLNEGHVYSRGFHTL